MADPSIDLVTINGRIVGPDGRVVTSGKLTTRLLPVPGTIDDTEGTPVTHLIGGFRQWSILDGYVRPVDDDTGSFQLVPNEDINPAQTYYEVTIYAKKPTRYTTVRGWSLNATPDPIDIGDISEVSPPSSVVRTVLQFITVASLPAAGADMLSRAYHLTVLDSGNPPGFYVCMQDPDNPGTYDWIMFATWGGA